MLNAAKIRELLHLEPHPIEGGYFAETYRSREKVPQGARGAAYMGERLMGTAIFYLLTPETFSAVHKLPGDELFHFYLGDPVEMVQLQPDGAGEILVLGQDIEAGMRLQHAVPGGCWQGSRLIAGGEFALLGTTMSPGFDYADFELADRATLLEAHPEFSELIKSLTKS